MNNVWNCWLYLIAHSGLPYRAECAGSWHFDVDKTPVDSDRARTILARNAFSYSICPFVDSISANQGAGSALGVLTVRRCSLA